MNLKPEELVKALRHCSNDYPCKTCPVELQKDESTCIGVLFKHCIDRIERDQKEIAELRAALEKATEMADTLNKKCDLITKKLEQLSGAHSVVGDSDDTEGGLTMERMISWNKDCVWVNGHVLYNVTWEDIAMMADRLSRYEDADSPMMRIRPGDTVWLSQMFYTHPKKPLPVTVDAIRIDREGVMFIAGRWRFSEEAIGKTVFLSKEEAEKALQGMEE